MLNIAAFLLGLLLLVFVLQDAFEVMLLPRRVARRWRLTGVFFAAAWRTWRSVALVSRAGPRRERFLGIFGALSMMLLFSLWAASLIVAFGLMLWAAQAGPQAAALSLADQLYMSGSTFFTLGYGDVAPAPGIARLLAVVEAGAGLGFIAVVIGYLPVLYQLFSRREAHVIQLDARAGTPPTAIVMLQRHAEGGAVERLDDVLRAWEVWGAELLESHLSYPMLVFYRSQHDDQSWLAAIAALMDACALVLIGAEDLAPLQARMTFAMLRQVLVELARSLRLKPGLGARLSEEDASKLLVLLERGGFSWNGGPEAMRTLAALRATYEPLLSALSEHLLLPLPGWLPATHVPDHWERGPRGVVAKRLVEGLAEAEPTRRSVPRR